MSDAGADGGGQSPPQERSEDADGCADGVWAAASKARLLGGHACRAGLWRDLVDAVDDAGAVDAHADELAGLAVTALAFGGLAGRTPRSLAHQAVTAALKQSPTFARALAGGLLKAFSSKASPPPRDAALGAAWAGTVLAALAPADAERAAAKLIDMQAALLAASAGVGTRGARYTRRAAVRRALQARPGLAPAYAAAAAKAPSVAAALAENADVLGLDAQKLLGPLLDAAVGGRDPAAAAAAVRALTPFVRAMPASELEAGPLPAALRAAKRSPEAGLTVAAALVEAVSPNADLSPSLPAIMDATLTAMRTGSPAVAAAARRLVAAGSALSGGDKLDAALDMLLSALGAGGAPGPRPRAVTERVGLLEGVLALAGGGLGEGGNDAVAVAVGGPGIAAGAPKPIPQANADRAATALADFCESEGNEDALKAALAAAAAWAARGHGPLPPALASRVAACLKSPAGSAPRREALRALARTLLANPAARAGAEPLVPALIKAVADGASKPAARADGVAAALAACLAVGSGAKGGQALWDVLGAPDCGLLAPATLGRLPPDDAALAAALAGDLLVTHSATASGALYQAAAALTDLQLHASASVRRAANAAATCVAALAGAGAPAAVAALLHWLSTTDGQPPGAAASEGATTVPPRAEATADRAQAALAALLPRRDGPTPPPEMVADALLIAHHLTLTAARRRAAAPWQALRGSGAADRVVAGVEAHAAAVVARLMAAALAAESDDRVRAAACAAIGAAASAASAQVWPALLPALCAATDRGVHDALTPAEIKIFLTPPGELAIEPAAEVPGAAGGASKAKAAPAPAPARKAALPPTAPAPRRAANGAPPPSRSTSRGGVGAPKKDAAAVWLEEALEREAGVRADVASVARSLEHGLAALGGSAAGAPDSAGALLDDLTPLVTPLLASPVVGGAAMQAAACLAACLPRAARVNPGDLAAALGAAARGEDPAACAPAAAAVAALGAAARRRVALPPPAATLVSPALAAVLARPAKGPLHDDALDALEAAAGRATGAHAGDAARVLYDALCAVPAYGGRVAPLLAHLGAASGKGGLGGVLAGLVSPAAPARAAALAALAQAPDLGPASLGGLDAASAAALWAARHDPDPANAAAAASLWSSVSGGGPPPAGLIEPLAARLASPAPDVRAAAAGALADLVGARPDDRTAVLEAALAAGADVSPATRCGAAAALRACAPTLTLDDARGVVEFLLTGALADGDDDVRAAMVGAGRAVVDAAGAGGAGAMLPAVEAGLAAASATCAGDEVRADALRSGAAVLLGAAAGHLPPGDPRVAPVLEVLLDVLRTPSAAVQLAAADCLPGLVPALGGPDAQRPLVDRLLTLATTGPSYGDRMGAAYGLAGAVKGLGLSAVNGFGVLDAVKAAVGNAADARAREGGLMLFEALCERLGRLFEPYVVQVMPLLLERFGDANADVRAACDGAARAVMANLSSQGVKLVLPTLMDGAAARAWRTQAGSVQMLGAMAHCAPRQLSTALPSVVPRLAEALADPHPKVAAAARAALTEVGTVVRNAEVRSLAPALLAAIADPAKDGKKALDILLKTTFVNTVDAASLALVVPVLHRGLRDRGGDTKTRAARIVGSMAALIGEPKDLAPYVPLLLPEVETALVDPLPEVRATSARALGSLLRGMGEAHFADLLPRLLAGLTAEGASVERSGSAQGLAEVLAVLGPAHVDALLPRVLAGCGSRSPAAREGSLALFRFLPTAMPQQFQAHLASILPAVLGGLADDADGVRDAALAAARTSVDLYADDALDLLLPAVEAGAAASSWRIRQSSVELLGDLLFKVAGTTGRARADGGGSDDEGAAADDHGAAITAALGPSRRADVLGLLYMCRSDVAHGVRGAALHVWKSVVSNTPRTLTEVTPALMDAAVAALASDSEDRRATAGRCLGELVRKLGDRALRVVTPILATCLASPDADTRRGAAAGVRELIDSLPRHKVVESCGDLITALQATLADADPGVRAAAGAAFASLFRSERAAPAERGERGERERGERGGERAVADALLPPMLAALAGPEPGASRALEGLRVVLSARPQALATMLPRLLRPPLTPASARALGSLCTAAGPAVHPHLSSVVPALLDAAAAADAGEAADAAAALDAVCAATAEDGAYLLIARLEAGLGDGRTRAAAARALERYCAAGRVDVHEHVPQLLTALITLLADDDGDTLGAVLGALKAVAASIPKEDALSHARCVREAVATAVERARKHRARAGAAAAPPPEGVAVPGLCVPGSLGPLLPIYLQGVLQGSAELREVAADGLGELVAAAGPDVLKPHVVQITGPLIRIIGDRFPWEVRCAILRTLGALLQRAGPGLRPFVPQLQTTFVKSLGDASRQVRQQAASNLGALAGLSARADALAADLAAAAVAAGGSGGAPPPGAPPAAAGGAEPVLTALTGALTSAGDKLTPPTVAKAAHAAAGVLAGGACEAAVACGAAAFGAAAALMEGDALAALLDAGPLGSTWPPDAAAAALAAVARRAPARLAALSLGPRAAAAAVRLARQDGGGVRASVARAAGYLGAADAGGTLPGALGGGVVGALVALLGPDQDGDTQRAAMQALRRVAVANVDALTPHLGDLVPPLCSLLASAGGPTKLAAERTLARCLAADAGPDRADAYLAAGQPGALARTYLTDTFLRRLGRLPLDPADADDFGEP